MSRFTFKSPRNQSAGWFRVGDYEIGTTLLVALTAASSFVLYAISPTMVARLGFISGRVQVGTAAARSEISVGVLSGEVWRIVSWPFANSPRSVWNLLAIALFWYFGKAIEEEIGRIRMAKFLGTLIIGIGIWATVISFFRPVVLTVAGDISGIAMLELCMLVAFAIERPNAPFFFGIPAKFIAGAFVAIDVLRYIGDDRGELVLTLAGALLMTAVLLRTVGLGDSISQIPALPGPIASWFGGRPRPRATVKTPAKRRSTAPLRAVPTEPGADAARRRADQEEIDRLLDKISSSGMSSLTPEERSRLEQASKQRP